MENDPFFSGSTPSKKEEIVPVYAKSRSSDKKGQRSENKGKSFRDTSFKSKDHKPFNKDTRKGKSDDKGRKDGGKPKFEKHENKFNQRDQKYSSRHEKNEEKRPAPPNIERRPRYVDPRARLPSMLNDIARPKDIKINIKAPPGSFKFFSASIPDVITPIDTSL